MTKFSRSFRRKPAKAGQIIEAAEATRKAFQDDVDEMLKEQTEAFAENTTEILERFHATFVVPPDQKLRRHIARQRLMISELRKLAVKERTIRKRQAVLIERLVIAGFFLLATSIALLIALVAR